MKDDKQGLRSVLVAIVCAIFFVIIFLIVKWNFFVVAALSILLYFALTLLTSPVRMLGGVAVEKIDQGQRLVNIYDLAKKNMDDMSIYQSKIRNLEISKKSKAMNEKGHHILNYLSKNPKSISTSEHFLDYYLDTANKILSNYVEMQDSNISQEKESLIQEETSQSLDYLKEIFTKQLDSYYDDKILSLEVESDLLEKTVKLGGGRK